MLGFVIGCALIAVPWCLLGALEDYDRYRRQRRRDCWRRP